MKWVGVSFASGLPNEVDPWVLSANNLISVLVIVAVTTLYSTTGGLRSVVQTDVMQLGLMLVGTVAYAGWVLYEVGGFSAMHEAIRARFDASSAITAEQITAFTPGWAKEAGFAVLAAFGLQWLLQINADGTGYLAQRSMACRSDEDARVASVWFTVTQVLLRSLLWVPIGLGLLVLFPLDGVSGDLALRLREATYVQGMSDLLPPGVLGLMVAGMLAALASTVDTHLNWGASYWTNDIYARFICRSWLKREPEGRELVWVARASNVLILAIALATMTQLSSIRETWQASLLLGAGIGPMLVGRWLWWRFNAWGEIASIVASLVALPVILALIPSEQYALRLLVMALVATVTGTGVALLIGPEERETLENFYRRVRPPGFWGPIAQTVGDQSESPQQRLWDGLKGMGLWGLAVFSLLIGLGSWLADSPAPAWFPVSAAWSPLLLVVGGVSVFYARGGLKRHSPSTE
ncbi:MAG: sodium transporter, partial [Myxococcota bacterium]